MQLTLSFGKVPSCAQPADHQCCRPALSPGQQDAETAGAGLGLADAQGWVAALGQTMLMQAGVRWPGTALLDWQQPDLPQRPVMHVLLWAAGQSGRLRGGVGTGVCWCLVMPVRVMVGAVLVA